MKLRNCKAALLALFVVLLPVCGQAGVGVGLRVGTTGIGGEVAVELVPDYLNFRLAGNGGYLNLEVNEDDATYDSDITLMTWMALLDWHVGGGPFKFVVGGCYNGSDADGTADPTEPIEIGDIEYTPAQIGTLVATAEYDTFGAYLGIGFGNLAMAGGRWTASVDLGIMYFFSEPDLTLDSRGGLLSETRQVQRELEQELDDFSDDYIEWLRYYPVLSLGVAVRF
jgi:hypothetical protein